MLKKCCLIQKEQNELFERIMDAKKAVEAEPWEAITSNAQARKIFEVEKV
ncbi:Nitrite reductase [NAD(P)H] large subunit [Staphylococcus aureus]|uniref:Nitrite reductase [NAD(P)H] large subunit n=1 Tax=Staphylococcus aureus TaxID=1280 RepID=A0A2X2JQW8_STAAU|nr:Nitrite reductase [NAD(P)H] large subunit [Staphylococcus aureus]